MIGVFDSGVGGLTVIKEVIKNLPECQIIYFGDTARLPYGTKGEDFIKKYSAKITDWLLSKGVKVVIIACHTSSAWAGDFLKNDFKGVPIFEMITPGAREAARATKNGKIGIIGTPGTIKSLSWQKKLLGINPRLKIYAKSCPLFVPLVEEGWINKKVTRNIVKEYLKHFKKKEIDSLILACTHYPVLEKIIKKEIGRKVKIINPAKSLAKELKLFLKNNPGIASAIKKGQNHKFFFSDEPYNLNKISKLCLAQKIKPIIKNPF